MATKTHTHTVPHPHQYRHFTPPDPSSPPTSTFHPTLSTSEPFRREKTAPPTFNRTYTLSKPSTTRFNPYNASTRPTSHLPAKPKLLNIIEGVHTSLTLPPYRSIAENFLVQVKDPTELTGTPPETEVVKGQNALLLAQAVRSTSHAQQVYINQQIAEGEAVLTILRKKAEEAEARLQQADFQLGRLRGHLLVHGIPLAGIADQYMADFNVINDAFASTSSDEASTDEDDTNGDE
ncbi:hypothetical protein BDZ94DRAFT_1321144 [Collybia nuda]|uniref:Uncharacterized protein n=1 Tax=Collybia nuda TaxID=64659 RepID=A0A9P5Y9D9_9AGAR|nr:hypothetical protein BDZ94DRAFT_1321144 [Collybia nuda]